MTREEQIQEAKDKTFPTSKEGRSYESAWAAGGFEMGAHWADENPNLESLWHDSIEEPKKDMDILFISKKGKVHKVSKIDHMLYDWLKDNDGINKWAYISELLPSDNVTSKVPR